MRDRQRFAVPLSMVGITYRTAPLAVREGISCNLQDAFDPGGQLGTGQLPSGAVVLSTCHRVEVYVPQKNNSDGQTPDYNLQAAKTWLAQQSDLEPVVLTPHLITRRGEAVIWHLLTVAAGLDSMLLGEGEILAQVRTALQQAPPGLLHRLLEVAVRTGKRVRSETTIGQGNPSLAGAAIKRLQAAGAAVKGAHILILGSGWMARALVQRLVPLGPAKLTVACRRPQAAAPALQAAAGPGAANGTAGVDLSVVSLEQTAALLAQTDLAFTATRAPEPPITAQMLTALMAQRGSQRPLWAADLAVPRDVEPPGQPLPGLHLFTVDELVDPEAPRQQQTLAAAQAIVMAEGAQFIRWLRSRQSLSLLRRTRQAAADIQAAEVARALNKMGPLTDRQRQVLETMAHRLTEKLLHGPTVVLREGFAAAAGGEGP